MWRGRLGRGLALLDVAVIGLSSLLAYWIRQALGQAGLVREFSNEVPAAFAVLPLWILLLYFSGAYRPEYLNSGGDAFRRFTAGVSAGVLTLGFMSFLLNLQLSRLFVGLLFLLVFLLGGIVRIGVRRHLVRRYARGELIQRVMIVGADHEGQELARALGASRYSGYRLVGFLDDDRTPGSEVDGHAVLGPSTRVFEEATAQQVGLVIVSPSGVPAGTLQEITLALEGSPIDLAVAPSLFQVVTRRVTVESVANVPILHVDQIRLGRGKAGLKRTLDFLAATMLGLVLLPVGVAAAAAIRFDDGGPSLFRQVRVGKDGRQFDVLKFRTMVPDADRQQVNFEHLNEVGDKFFKVREDPRVTRVGRFLRRWSIDEIPQLWNVLRGDMSMVGPRPPVPSEVAQYTAWEHRRLRVRPGITGVWQTSGRSNIPFDEAIRLDLFYIENWSLGYDLFLLGKTVVAVLSRRGAY